MWRHVYFCPKKLPDSIINVTVEFEEDQGRVLLNAIAERAKEYQPKPKTTYNMYIRVVLGAILKHIEKYVKMKMNNKKNFLIRKKMLKDLKKIVMEERWGK